MSFTPDKVDSKPHKASIKVFFDKAPPKGAMSADSADPVDAPVVPVEVPVVESPEDIAARVKAKKEAIAVDMDGQRKVISGMEDDLVRARLKLDGMIRQHNLAR